MNLNYVLNNVRIICFDFVPQSVVASEFLAFVPEVLTSIGENAKITEFLPSEFLVETYTLLRAVLTNIQRSCLFSRKKGY